MDALRRGTRSCDGEGQGAYCRKMQRSRRHSRCKEQGRREKPARARPAEGPELEHRRTQATMVREVEVRWVSRGPWEMGWSTPRL